ncbi:MAG TPA: cytochrome c maturation protein CcmE [Bryobacteraceae bacterium]|jgi:cytochrome c-type biogenesis protein CcmE
MNRYLKFGIPITVILAAVAWLAMTGIGETKTYFKTLPELEKMGDQAHAKRLRVSGYVKTGSIVHDGTQVRFLIVENPGGANEGRTLAVSYRGIDPLPDTFKDQAQALVDGKLSADGTFEAKAVQAKCASKYEALPPPASSKPAAATTPAI